AARDAGHASRTQRDECSVPGSQARQRSALGSIVHLSKWKRPAAVHLRKLGFPPRHWARCMGPSDLLGSDAKAPWSNSFCDRILSAPSLTFTTRQSPAL